MQIIVVLREQVGGKITADVYCRHWISSATFHKWKAKSGGLDVSDAGKLKAPKEENAKQKKLLPMSILRAGSVSKIRDIRGLKNQQRHHYKFFRHKKLKGAIILIIRNQLVAFLIASVVAGSALASETPFTYVEDNSLSYEVLGVGTGQVLVSNLANACPHVVETLKASKADQIVLLLADQEMQMFSTEACVGKCDRLQLNSIVLRCRQDAEIKGCVICGAIFEKKIHMLAIDGTPKHASGDLQNNELSLSHVLWHCANFLVHDHQISIGVFTAASNCGNSKHTSRKAISRSVKAVEDAISNVLPEITKQECQNYFINAGYTSA